MLCDAVCMCRGRERAQVLSSDHSLALGFDGSVDPGSGKPHVVLVANRTEAATVTVKGNAIVVMSAPTEGGNNVM